MSSHAISATVCRVCRRFAANACDTSLPFAEKCHGYIYIPGSTAKGITALGKASKTGYDLPQMVNTPNQPKRKEDLSRQSVRDRIANEARHVWRRHTRDAIAATAKGALNEIGGNV